MKITVLDLETTGLVPKGLTYEKDYMLFPYILGMAWKVNGGTTYEYIINQEDRIVPPEATKINGITQEMCDSSNMNTFTVLLQFIMDANESDFIVGHNLYFDTSIIKANVLRIISGGKTPIDMFNVMTNILHKDKRVDTMRLGIKLCKKWPTLSELYMKLFNEQYESHRAGNDVDACYRIYCELVKRGVIILPEPVIVEEEE